MPKRTTKQRSPRAQIIAGSIICVVGALFYCYEFILRILPGILQDELRVALGHISATAFGQIAALYYFAYAPMQLPVGILIDRYGPRYLLTLACLCCTIGSLMFSSHVLFIVSTGRLLVGFGSAFAFVGVLSAAVNWLPKRYFSLVAGLMTTVGMLGLVYGEIQITQLAHQMGLQAALISSISLGVILTILLFVVVRDAPGKRIQQHQPFPVFCKQVLQVLRSKQIWIIAIIGACLYTAISVFGELWGNTFLEHNYHLSKIQAAQTMSMLFLGWAVGAPLMGYFSDRSGQRLLPLVLGATGSLVCICLILFNQTMSFHTLNFIVFLFGICSVSEIIVFIMAKEHSPTQELSGTIFAVVNMIVSFGGMIFQPMVGTLLDWSAVTISKLPIGTYSTIDYQIALSVIPISMLLVLGLALYLKLQAKKQVSSSPKNSQ